ncbi:Similar to Long-chain-fatty-acid--CoA ligase 1; acc. no. O60135 [Pyronema omphalodes CBS 100304]|uniref:Similar to Long-chain-fatty-acid--CoA ligase 1 acc. no. O60135 n=1 Tax=Pyronema omphalodes (strain CBS 100304) TaxID=1076935 RepID=U4LSW1_PYROM|nr:Similar to Long-chain-fatty-acid--CoA ligase 1; acc. no. O60135 [Pyronema omphalodes CBS 100304]
MTLPLAPISQYLDLETTSALFTHAVGKFTDNRCVGYRKVVGHVLETRLLGDWQYYTYKEVGRRARLMAAGLKKLLKGGNVNRLYMAAPNSCIWFMLSHAAPMASIELICVNPRLSQQELSHTLTHVPATAVFTEGAVMSRLLTPLIECPHVRLIVYNSTSEVDADREAIQREVQSLKVGLGRRTQIISVKELCAIGLEVLDITPLNGPIDKDGTWGYLYARTLNEPELPMPDRITNAQVVAGVSAMHHALTSGLLKDDTYLSYLPLYFRLEYNLVNALFLSGITIGFGTDVDAYLLSAPFNSRICPASYGDIQSFQPTILFGIKPWWDIVHTKLLKALSKRSQDQQKQFWYYIEKKRDAVAGILPTMVSISHLCEKWGHIAEIRSEFFGERIRWVGVTCSMMTNEQREFLGLVFGGPRGVMVQGWPLTNINCDITFMDPQHHSRIGLGRPLPSVEIKMVTGKHESAQKRRGVFRGQIHIRGPSLVSTAAGSTGIKSRDPEDWIPTGRLGEWDTSLRSLQVVDNPTDLRIRHLGEYVPVEKLEAIYKKVEYVRDCVLFHSWKSVELCGVFNMNETSLRRFFHSRFDDDLLRLEIGRDLNKHGSNEGLVGFELVGPLLMVYESWDKNFRNSDGSIDREKIMSKYKTQIEDIILISSY